ncbi:unnamed protein product [Eruca vesicaria subsp. sativa]|uniref:Bulb-type lectin domain-containing protein n=1 Tax=Eruca vesicaria subsp. sativa TaxID=29727 RepID=A0ABC8LIG7_ERUVS|nr:unnamed protein product [Eruca vesicaria subsp. sativa]
MSFWRKKLASLVLIGEIDPAKYCYKIKVKRIDASIDERSLSNFKSKITPRVYVWVANRENPVTSLTANLTISSNGTLILLDEKQKILWSSGQEVLTSNKCRAEHLNSVNLVVVDNVTGTYLWQSFEHLTDTMLLRRNHGVRTERPHFSHQPPFSLAISTRL